MMQWVTHVPSPRLGVQVQDFRKLNKVAIADKVLTARDVKKASPGDEHPTVCALGWSLFSAKGYPI